MSPLKLFSVISYHGDMLGPDSVSLRSAKRLQIRIMARCTGHPADKLEHDISRPRYFNPYEAIEYGIIDKVHSSYFAGRNLQQSIGMFHTTVALTGLFPPAGVGTR